MKTIKNWKQFNENNRYDAAAVDANKKDTLVKDAGIIVEPTENGLSVGYRISKGVVAYMFKKQEDHEKFLKYLDDNNYEYKDDIEVNKNNWYKAVLVWTEKA
jgi:hypothetical protein